MAEKVVTEQPKATPYLIHPTAEVNTVEIKQALVDAFGNLKTDGTGLSGTHASAPAAFEVGLFDCFADIPTCLLSWCCGPCLFHRTYHVMNRAPHEFPEEDFVGGTCASFCVLGMCTGIGACLWASLRRGAIREKYNLQGSTRMDFALTCCCGPCTIAQEDMEVRKKEKRKLLEYQSSQQSGAAQHL